MLDTLLKKQNLQWLLFLVLIYSTSIFVAQKSRVLDDWTNIVCMDGRGYYAYLPAVFIFQDLGLDFYEKHSPVPGDEANFLMEAQGGKVNKYSYGVSLALLPFFLIGWAYSFFAGYPLTGHSQPFCHAVFFGAIFYLGLGLYYLRRLLNTFDIKQPVIYMVLILIYFGTNLFHYTVYEPSMSHVYSFAAMSAFCFFTRNFFVRNNPRAFLWMAVALALIMVIRPVNVLIVLAIPFLAGSFGNIILRATQLIKTNKKLIFYSLLAFLAIVGIQALFWYLQTGHWLVYSYGNEKFVFAKPEILNVLFSYRKGLFLYTPLILLSLLGFLPLFRKSRFGFASLLFFMVVLVYVFASWECWYYGWSFGQRGFIDYYPVFAILLALFFNNLISKPAKLLATAAALSILLVSAVQTFQISNKILLHDGMDKEAYWDVFLKTDSNYSGYLLEKEKQRISQHYSDYLAGSEPVFKSKITFDEQETPLFWQTALLKQGEAFSGNMANLAGTPANHYSSGFSAILSDISPVPVKFVQAKVRILQDGQVAPYFLIVSVEGSGKLLQYNSLDLSKMPGNKEGWELKEYVAALPESDPAETSVKVHIVSGEGAEVLIDDFELFFY
ncbi:MAG: hypothetical protein H0X62_07685 [Bacteroidetes bacterium]|nr:hypothetical protein [Bacteroidota bacterium]